MAIGCQVEKLVSAVAFANHRAGRRLEFEAPLPLHRVALRTLQINGTGWSNSDPGMAALDAEGLAAAVRVALGGQTELDDVGHARTHAVRVYRETGLH